MKEYWNSYIKYNLPFHVFALVSIGLAIASFCIPPHGVVDRSVLQIVGELMGFAGLWSIHVAVQKGGVGKIRHGKTEVEIIPKKDERED